MNVPTQSLSLWLGVLLIAGCASRSPTTSSTEVPDMNKPFVALALLSAKPGKQQALKAGLLKLIEPTRAEPGNLDYVLFEMKDKPGTFYMREAFKNKEAFDAHVAAPYFKQFAATTDDLLSEPLRLILLDQVSQ